MLLQTGFSGTNIYKDLWHEQLRQGGRRGGTEAIIYNGGRDLPEIEDQIINYY